MKTELTGLVKESLNNYMILLCANCILNLMHTYMYMYAYI